MHEAPLGTLEDAYPEDEYYEDLMRVTGGIGLLVGPLGLVWLKARRDEATSDASQTGMDVAFIVLLLLTSLSGLALLALRESTLMGWLLVVHLGVVLALFLVLPYGKFVHSVYRGAALIRYAPERSRPKLNIGGEG